MSRFSNFIKKRFIDTDLSFESRTLNFVCFLGAMAGVVALISRFAAGLPFITIAPLILMIAAILGVLFISIIKAKYADVLTTIIVCGVSFIFWPALFFTIGGPASGMAVYFALAIILDFTLLKEKPRVFAIIMTCVVMVFCYVSTLFWGWNTWPDDGLSTYQRFVDFMQSILIVGFLMGAIIMFQTSLYQNEKNKTEAAIAERNESMQQLKSAQFTTSAMFESNPHINILFDSSFKVIDCNPAAVRFMRFDTKEEMLAGFAERIAGSIPPVLSTGRQTRPIVDYFIAAAKEGFVRLDTEFILGGVRRNVDVELKRIPYKDSFAIVGYILDMTEVHEREMELRRRDQQLSEAVEAAEAANKAKSAFLSTMSHEIRTPMNAILGITEIQLQNDTLDPGIREAFGKVYASGDMLLGIINDILDLSKIESGKLELMIDKYEIASLISDTAQLNIMRIGSKPIEFELLIDENIPAAFLGDELRIKQILNNVLSNAFKYTLSGTVKLSVAVEEAGGDTDGGCVTLLLCVIDTGQGMTKEQVDKLFDEYSRFNLDANRSTEGTGLGMSITRNLVRLMKGDISVESEPGKGSTFTIRLPQGKTGDGVIGEEIVKNLQQFRSSSRAQMKRVQITREPMPYGRILIVDDVETNIYVARGLLAPYGLKIDTAESGFAAIEKIKNGSEYDIVFMDHMMPLMDGIEATKKIRDMGYSHPVVALTANAVSGQADIFLGSGFDDFISKPIDVRQLNLVLNKLIRDKQPPEVIEAARKAAEAKRADVIKERSADGAPPQAIDPHLARIFVRDVLKSLSVIEAIVEKNSYGDEDDLRSYTINVHGMKSALGNIGKTELSAIASRLETSARDGDIAVISAETPAFLRSLRGLTEELTPKEEAAEAETTDEDMAYLREKLLEVKTACGNYDKKNAREAIKELMDKSWPQPAKELLEAMSEKLLHSDFDSVAGIVDSFNNNN